MQLRDDLALIGNCQFSAIVDRAGGIVWCCLPRFDSEPVFSSLLHHNKGGRFVVTTADGRPGFGSYLDETNVLETTFETDEGSFRVIDFAPRFILNDRMFRPTQLYRIVEPLSGTPRVRVDCAPRIGWSRASPARFPGSSHVSYGGYPSPLRLTTDIPLTYLDGRAFALTQKRHLALAWGPPIEEPIEPLCDRLLGETVRYWQRWIKHCSIPPLFQDDAIRAALALKLHCFEDTGAVATSMIRAGAAPLDPWAAPDGPVCDLGQARHALAAFRRLGHFEERERFVEFLLNIVGDRPERALSPVYRIDGASEQDLDATVPWGPTPARPTSAEVALALTPLFVDDRYQAKRSKALLEVLQGLARKAVVDADVPATGLRDLLRASSSIGLINAAFAASPRWTDLF